MRRPLPVDVEPLSEQRWARIERATFARLALEAAPPYRGPARSKAVSWRPWFAAVAVAACVVLAFALNRQLVPEQAALDQPSHIITGVSASHLALPGVTVDVGPESAVVVGAETPQGMLIVLDRGTITCSVAPRPRGAPLIVQAGSERVRVVGTRFDVSRVGDGARVQVYEGVVEVSSGGHSSRVAAGEVWVPRDNTEGATDAPKAGSGEAVAKDGTTTESPSTPSSASGAVVGGMRTADGEGSASKSAAAGTDARGESDEAPQAPAKGQASEGLGAARARSVPPRRAKRSAAEQTTEPSPVAHARERAGEAVRVREPAISSQTLFERATSLERSDPGQASRLYGKLEAGSDSWAQNALYARGRLEASRGNATLARRLLERYLQRFPQGSNAADARAVLRRLR